MRWSFSTSRRFYPQQQDSAGLVCICCKRAPGLSTYGYSYNPSHHLISGIACPRFYSTAQIHVWCHSRESPNPQSSIDVLDPGYPLRYFRDDTLKNSPQSRASRAGGARCDPLALSVNGVIIRDPFPPGNDNKEGIPIFKESAQSVSPEKKSPGINRRGFEQGVFPGHATTG